MVITHHIEPLSVAMMMGAQMGSATSLSRLAMTNGMGLGKMNVNGRAMHSTRRLIQQIRFTQKRAASLCRIMAIPPSNAMRAPKFNMNLSWRMMSEMMVMIPVTPRKIRMMERIRMRRGGGGALVAID